MAQVIEDVVELARALCAIPSLTGSEAAVCQAVAEQLEAHGLVVQRQDVPGGEGGRQNLLVLPEGARGILTTHLDTVPPFIPPHDDGEWLTGRGTCDAKGVAAAMICAHDALRARGEERVGLLFVVGEETDSDGAKAAAEHFLPPLDFFVDGEPTELRLCSAMKGALVFDVAAKGKACHSAYPELGHSAVHQLIDDLHRLLAHPWPTHPHFGPSTLNVGTLEGGQAPNVLASHARARCILRTTAPVDELTATVRGLLTDTTELDVRSSSSPQELTVVPGFDTCVVAFGSDVPYLARRAERSLLFGPGSIHDAHTAHERVRKQDLVAARDAYALLCEQLLAPSPAPSATPTPTPA